MSILKATTISKGSRHFGIQVPKIIVEVVDLNLVNKNNYFSIKRRLIN